jgi:predicted Fe-S protein YdhL (DUF1289 family)
MITPCIQVCQINYSTGLCVGCYRTLTEITNWSQWNDQQRLAVMSQLTNRKKSQ